MDASMYPPIDYTPLLVPGEDIVVRCDTEDEAKHLVARMMCDYPEKCVKWDMSNVHFGWYRYDATCYRPNINMNGMYLRYGTLSYYQSLRFTIIPFSDLLMHNEIDESDSPIEFLLS